MNDSTQVLGIRRDDCAKQRHGPWTNQVAGGDVAHAD